MKIINAEAASQHGATVKFILNDTAIIFFPATQQHRDVKIYGLSYEDDYLGNAVAGLLTDEKVEVRFHKEYPDGRIQQIWHQLRAMPELTELVSRKFYYQGREIL